MWSYDPNINRAYTNNHMIAELAEPRLGANVPRPFPRVVGLGVWPLKCHLHAS